MKLIVMVLFIGDCEGLRGIVGKVLIVDSVWVLIFIKRSY